MKRLRSASHDRLMATIETVKGIPSIPRSLPKRTSSKEEASHKTNERERRISLEELSKHVTSDDLWTVIDGVVYDFSSFVSHHPGGPVILLTGGTDSTVVYHQYHFHQERRHAHLLSRSKVGAFEGESPRMGLMFADVKKRVIQCLADMPRRPQAALSLFLLDWCALVMLFCFSLTTSILTPTWQLLVFTFVAPILLLRNFGQAHALGHMHICSAEYVSLFSKALLALSSPGVSMFLMPVNDKNPRALMNESRPVAQGEFPQRRGPGEHQCIHHVKGAELEDDECYQVASMFGVQRLSPRQKHYFNHRFQHYRVYMLAAAVVSDIGLCMASIPERIGTLISFFIPQRLWGDACCAIVGLGVAFCILRTQLLIVWLHGLHGVLMYLAVALLKYVLLGTCDELFYGQHKWDYEIDAGVADQDWFMHNAESSASVRGQDWNPVCWGMGGACPSSLTYHLEHTLFPGVNYLYLPKIAPVVEAALREYNVPFTVLDGHDALHRDFKETMERYSKPEKID